MAYVQQVEQDGIASATTLASGNLPSGVTSGNMLWVVVTYYRPAGQVTVSLADTIGGAYTQVHNFYNATDDIGIATFYKLNASAGTNSVTATFSSAAEYRTIYVAEYSEIAASSALAGNSGPNRQAAPGTSANALTSTNATPSGQPAWQIGFSYNASGTGGINAGSGFTARTAVWDFGLTSPMLGRAEDLRITSTAATPSTFTAGAGSDTYYTLQAIFLEPATGGEIAGSTTLAFTRAGALLATGALAGADVVAFSTTATAFTAGAIAGSDGLAFTRAGVVTGAGALAASDGLAFTRVGALLGTGNLAASVLLAFGASIEGDNDVGTLTGNGALAGVGAQVFATTATPEGGPIAGTAAVSFANSGEVAAAGAAAASDGIAFAPTAALRGAGTIAGADGVVVSEGGDLTGVGALVAAESLAFTAAGAVGPSDAGLVGVSAIAIAETAALLGIGSVAGADGTTFSSSGTGSYEGVALEGVAAIVVSNAGEMLGDAELLGSASVDFAAALTPEGVAVIDGAALLAFVASVRMPALMPPPSGRVYVVPAARRRVIAA